MKTAFVALLMFFFCTACSGTPEIPLTKGMVISRSVTIRKGIYRFNSDSLGQVITITGNNITVDFNGAELKGSNNKDWPNQFYGTGIFIKGGSNITIRNVTVNGYKIAVMARDAEQLTIQNSDFSYNYRQKLNSTRLREDVSDWMSYHHNENDEWMRYGAGIYLRGCNKVNIHDNIIVGGQCGLMMTSCNDGVIYNNNFSFNSGLGIGMYRSNRNKIMYNQLDFNVRGYSHGIFNRGQDSAGILVFEQCNDNTIAYNSVTHGGDGFFLWAGQHTMDSGDGGCNDNYVYRNDFSYAPTNGVEITFSRNIIKENIIRECDNGLWGGYSYNTNISGNTFEGNNVGIAIEHGQNNVISKNSFSSDKTAIKLWARKSQPPDWIYAQKRDTRSSNYLIFDNTFNKNNIGLQATLTNPIELSNNLFINVTTRFKSDSTVYIDSSKKIPAPATDVANDHFQIPKLNKTGNNFKASSLHPGRKEIRITRWGPYDYNYPILWLSRLDSSGKMFFDLIGPKGNWKIISVKGVKNLSATSGTFPASVTAEKTDENILVEAKYLGEKITTQMGKKYPANQPFIFAYSSFEPAITWDVKWYRWDSATDPNKNYEQFKKIFSGTPIKSETSKKLDYTWWGEIGKNLPADSFATVATGQLKVPIGTYDLGVTADDLVKVFIDGKPVIDFWDASKYINDDDAHHSAIINLDGNEHNVRVEHVENSGYATLIFSLEPLPPKNRN
jgi:parallel beta-helix repeat (two copies)